MIKTINFKTAFYKEDLFTKFKIKQDDTVKFNVTIEDTPNNFYYSGARILLRRSDKTVIYEEISVTKQDKTFSFKAPNGTTNISGTVYGELEFLDGNNSSGSTFVFVFDVVSRAGNITEAIESKDEIFIIDEIRAFIEQTKEDLKLLDTNTKELQKQQQVLDTKMENTTERVNELIREVEKRDLNVQELKKENGRAENNINDLRELNTTAQQLKDNAINDITNLKTSAIEEIEGLKDDAISNIEHSKNEVLTNIEEAKSDFINTSTEAKNALNSVVDEAKNTSGELGEKIQTGTEVISTINTSIELAEETKMALDNSVENGEQIKEILDEKILGANNIKEALESIIPTAENIKELLSRTVEEGNIILPELQELLSSLSGIEELLRGLNEEANNNINELNTLHPESNIRIETLRSLIEEAKKYETIVRDYIASQGGGVDLSEIHQALETLNGYIEDINNRFNNYYTKEEVDGLISSIDIPNVDMSNIYTKEEVNNLINNIDIPEVDMSNIYTKEEVDMLIEDKTGTIAGSLLPAPYSTEPGNPFGDDCYITVRAKDSNGVYHIGYGKYYNDSYPTYLSDNSCIYLSNASANATVYKYTETDKTWTAIANRTFVIAKSPIDVYTNNLDIKYHSNDPNKGQIWKEAFVLSGEEPEIDFNMAIEYKRYNINITAEDEIFNAPITGELKGVLTVDKASNNIIQTVITDQNKRYTRAYCDEIWSEWKEEKETYTKEEIDKIFEIGKITGGAGAVFDELPGDTFTGYPENPDPETYLWEMKCTHYNHHMIFYFNTDPSGKIGIVEKDSGSLGFKLLDSAFTYKNYKGYFRKATSTTGSWTAFTNDNHFIATSSRDINAIYYYNFDIMNGNNPEEVYLYGNPGITEDAITDFNKAIECKEYIVDIKPGTTALNSPEETYIKGILKVSSVEGIVHQALEMENKTYKRIFNGTWSKWYLLSEIDMSNIYTKEEVDKKVLSVTPKVGTLTADTTTAIENVEADFNNAHKCSMYNVRQVTNTIPNSPVSGTMYGVLKVSNVKALIHQTLETTTNRTFKRMLNGTWTAWKEITSSGASGGVDSGVVDNINSQINSINTQINELKTPISNKLNTYTYTNSDGMPEVYKWFNINGFKIMWIDVKLSENEYNSGSTGAMMKTLSFPTQAQIFSNIIMANIASYNRDGGTSTLSRVVQNAEIISKTSVRGRWRHTDNTYPRIDRFTIMCFGF